jgi:RNA-directed DNA polymerase
MTAIKAGAVSHPTVNWNAIDWQTVHETVRRLQARIVKATQTGRWGKVKALQHLLTHSFSGKALAVKRVTENQGKRTSGVDGDIWDTPAKKAEAITRMKQHGYRPAPLRRIYIPKSNGKCRPLSIPTMLDRAMQALYLLALDPVVETLADKQSYGFRKSRSCADAIEQVHIVLSRRISAQWVLEADIAACFDTINHNWLLINAPMDKTILQQWLKAGFIEKEVLNTTNEGAPQGGIISPALANLTLDGLESKLREKYPKKAYKRKNLKVNFIRYADDFIITGTSKELLENEVRPLVQEFLKERGLRLSDEKTSITHITEGFDFLGQTIRKYSNGKLLIKPSRQNVKTFLNDIRHIIKSNAQITAGELIARLNPKIKGWTMYHRHVSSSKTFSQIDHAIFQALWRWAVRRHPNKGKRWVKRKYFHRLGTRRWVFSGDIRGEVKHLRHATDTHIVRHRKIKGEANPYDPQWEIYFEKRLGLKMLDTLKGRRQLRRLWIEKNGLCPVCQQKITELTGWHNHHIVWRSHGGTDTIDNRVLLHPTCHRQVHTQGLSVVKPRSVTSV